MTFKEGERLIVVRYGELWLKGKNRGTYIQKLRQNILDRLAGESFRLEQEYDRLIIRLDKNSDIDSIRNKLGHVFGISNYELSYSTKPDLASIDKLAKKLLSRMDKKERVRIEAHRSYKGTTFNSVDIVDKVRKSARKLGLNVDNHDYASRLYVNLTKDAAFLTIEKTKALKGLPIGTSGKGVVLLSGGIDSPVAAWYAMKRGITPVYVHIHALPSNKDVIETKIGSLLAILSGYGKGYKIYCIPSSQFQMKVLDSGRYELILLKAFMLRLAEKIGEKEGAEVIFTGESLGQVASQTTSNIYAESHGIKMPILRPLIGFDKEEIIKVARQIGTYDESVKEYRDVCSIKSRNQATRIEIERMEALTKRCELDKMVKKALASASIFEG